MKKKKAIFKNLLIGNAVKQFSAIYNQMSTNEGGERVFISLFCCFLKCLQLRTFADSNKELS